MALCVLTSTVSADAGVYAQSIKETAEQLADGGSELWISMDTEMESGETAGKPAEEELSKGDAGEEGTEKVPSAEDEIIDAGSGPAEPETEQEPVLPAETETKGAEADLGGTETEAPEIPPAETETEGTEAVSGITETETFTMEAETEETESLPAETETEDVSIEEKTNADLNYIIQEKDTLEAPGVQNIVASIGKESGNLKDPVLNYRNLTTGQTFSVKSAAREKDMALFTIEFSDKAMAGIYQLLSITYVKDDKNCRIDLMELQMNISFGVDCKAESVPDQILSPEDLSAEVDASVVTMDENGNVISENTVQDVLNRGLAAGLSDDGRMRYVAGELKVVLDPGHDAAHAGAQYFGSGEENLTLKIAKFCRDELNTYQGVSVYMVRETEACPYGGGISSSECIIKRVDYAKDVGADVYVSFHLNADTNAAAHGVGVFYPNGNYNGQIGEEGKGLADSILKKLKALGLDQWADGIIIRNAVNDKYPDGSVADWTGVIRRNKLNGIPAVLIEHAFLSNKSDFDRFLSSDEKLKKLGVADASAIAEFYGLQKEAAAPVISYTQSRSDGTLKVKWGERKDAVSYQLFRSTKKDSGFTQTATVNGRTEYVDTGAKVETKYYYKVRAVLENGSISEESKPVAGRILKKAVINSVTMDGSKKLKLTWEKVTGASGYKVYRLNDKTGTYEQAAKVASGDSTSYVDQVASDHKKYSYKISAYNSSNGKEGNGILSEAASGMTIGKPSISSVVSKNEKDLKISWKKVKNAEGYQVYRSSSKDGKYEKIKTVSSGSTVSYEDKSVKKSKTYYYKVRAMFVNNGKTNYTAYSGIVSGKTIAKTSITKAASVSSSRLKLEWKKVSGAWGYRIKRSTSASGSYSTIATLEGKNKASFEDQSLKAGKKYYYKIEVINKVNGKLGYSGDSKAVYGKTAVKTSVSYVIPAGNGKAEIGWKNVEGAWGYRVKRSTSSTGSFKTIATVEGKDTSSYRDSSVKAGKKYYYVVETINKVNGSKGYSGNSKAVAGRVLGSTSITTVKTETSTTLTLKWKAVSGADGYEIRRSDSEKGSYQVIALVKGGKALSYKDTELKTGKNYFYKVRPYSKSGNKTGYASYSKAQKAWTVDRVQITKVTSSGSNKVSLEWNKVKLSGGYRIQRSTNGKTGFQTIGTVTSGSKLTYTDKSVKAGGVYYYRIAAVHKVTGNTEGRGSYSKTAGVPVLSKTKLNSAFYNINQAMEVTWSGTGNAEGYQISRGTDQNGSFESLAKLAKTAYTDRGVSAGTTYYYKVRPYAKSTSGTTVYGPWSEAESRTAGYEISGSSSLSVEQMTNYYNARYQYPSSIYAAKGAETSDSFFAILKEEAESEGIRTEVLFAQVILETGGLNFQGDVGADQCNFGGLGATGNGVKGEVFPDVRTGLRAQTQHLKAYAGKEALNHPCVDQRFHFVRRGSAPYVEWLSIPQNPNGGGWAMDPDYAGKLYGIMRAVL